jgi:hypothetical protein
MKRTAAIILGLAVLAAPAAAQPSTLSDKVRALLTEAKKLTISGNYKSARAKVNEADAVKSTAYDAQVIDHMKHYIQIKAGEAPLAVQPSHP